MLTVKLNRDYNFLSDNRLYVILLITVFISIITLINTDFGEYFQYVFLILGTVLLGIPHGANDNIIFYKNLKKTNTNTKVVFYSVYLLMMLLAFIMWYLAPEIFLILFVLYSAHHFGQSNWFYLNYSENDIRKLFQYLAWGLYVIICPVLLNYDESIKIISFISNGENSVFNFLFDNKLVVTLLLITTNVLMILYYFFSGKIELSIATKEMLIFATLTILFLTTPLYLAFFAYWIFFHSYNSIIETSQFLNNSRSNRSIFVSLKKAVPLSLVSYIGIILLYFIIGDLSEEVLISVLFIAIACLTVPHMFVMQLVYTKLGR